MESHQAYVLLITSCLTRLCFCQRKRSFGDKAAIISVLKLKSCVGTGIVDIKKATKVQQLNTPLTPHLQLSQLEYKDVSPPRIYLTGFKTCTVM